MQPKDESYLVKTRDCVKKEGEGLLTLFIINGEQLQMETESQ